MFRAGRPLIAPTPTLAQNTAHLSHNYDIALDEKLPILFRAASLNILQNTSHKQGKEGVIVPQIFTIRYKELLKLAY